MASSSASQISWESKNYQNGVFTRRLIEGLRQNGDKTTLDQAFSYMKARVEEEVLRDRAQVQTPIMEKKWQGEAPTFAVVPTEPRPGLSDAAGGSINANGNPNANSRANTLPLKGRAGTKTK